MGAANFRLQKSQHKDKVTQFFGLFNGKGQIPSSRFQEILGKSVRLRIYDCKHLPNQAGDYIEVFKQYVQKFKQKGHSIELKKIKDVQFLNTVYEKFIWEGLANGKMEGGLANEKVEVYGQVWVCTKSGKIQQFTLKEIIKSGMSWFDAQWQIEHKKAMEYNTPAFRAKYAYQDKYNDQAQKKLNRDIAFNEEKRKEAQQARDFYFYQKRQQELDRIFKS